METILSVLNAIAMALVGIGAGTAVIFFIWAGFQFMMAQGEPQQIAKARSAFFGSMVGVIIMGLAFVVPRVISEAVLQPAGASAIASVYSEYDCDGMLQRQLEVQRSVNNEHEVNHLISLVQARNRNCSADIWNPRAGNYTTKDRNKYYCVNGHNGGNYEFSKAEGIALGGLKAPHGLTRISGTDRVRLKDDPVVRDGANNFMVVFKQGSSPNDGSICWIYFAQFDIWWGQQPRS